MKLEERLADLQAENATLREQLAAALAEIQELNGQLAKDGDMGGSIYLDADLMLGYRCLAIKKVGS